MALITKKAEAAALIAIGSYTASFRPSLYAASSFWTTSPTYFGLRTGLMMATLAGLYALDPLAAALEHFAFQWNARSSLLSCCASVARIESVRQSRCAAFPETP